METSETKIKRLLRTPGIFNFARQNKERFDETLREVRLIVDQPPQRSLKPVADVCTALANRQKTYSEAIDAVSHYTGYLRMAADEVIPALDEYLTRNQYEVAPELAQDSHKYPFARALAGASRAIPISPTFVTIEKGMLVPNYLLCWASVKFNWHQARLICSILNDGILSHQDYLGSDGRIIFLKRGKWEGTRDVETWRIRDYATMSRHEIEAQFERYNRAVTQVLSELQAG